MPPLPRSPELMSRDDTALLVVDVQEKLVPLIPGHRRLVWNIRRLIDGAKILGLPVLASEQYPKGLGHTVPELAERLGELPPLTKGGQGGVPEKLAFSCGACPELFAGLGDRGIHRLLVCGMETHVCVQQTVFDLIATGLHIYIPVDAVAARFSIDHETALRRMDSAGATLTTVEAALFEWCEASGTPEFKEISKLIREQGPAEPS